LSSLAGIEGRGSVGGSLKECTVPVAPVPCKLPQHRASYPGTVPASPVPCQLLRYRTSAPVPRQLPRYCANCLGTPVPVPCQLHRHRASCLGTPVPKMPAALAPCQLPPVDYHLPTLLAAQRIVQMTDDLIYRRSSTPLKQNFVPCNFLLFVTSL
jgi:hypothetical protein